MSDYATNDNDKMGKFADFMITIVLFAIIAFHGHTVIYSGDTDKLIKTMCYTGFIWMYVSLYIGGKIMRQFKDIKGILKGDGE